MVPEVHILVQWQLSVPSARKLRRLRRLLDQEAQPASVHVLEGAWYAWFASISASNMTHKK